MPTDSEAPRRFAIRGFDPSKHDRTDFSCGVTQIDNYLKLTAKKASKADVVRIWVVVDPEDRIIGFYGINMHAVHAGEMPEPVAKKALGHGFLPAAFIAMVGVDRSHQGRGLGTALLADALNRIAGAADEIAACVVVLDVLNDGDPDAVARRKAYYQGLGFIPLPDHPFRLFMPIETAREASNG